MKLITTLTIATFAVMIPFGALQMATAEDQEKLADLKKSLEKSGVEMSKAGIQEYLQQLTDTTVAEKLIVQLGSESFNEREAAQESLLTLPVTPTELLQKATQSSNAEVVWRVKKIMKMMSTREVDQMQTVENALRAISSLGLSGLTKEIAATVANFPNHERILLAAENAMVAVVTKEDIPFLSSQFNPKSNASLQRLAVRALRQLEEPELADQFEKWASDKALEEFARYRFLGQVAGFRATSCPVQTESDLIVAGRLPKDGNHRYEGKNVVWRVNANEVDVLHGLARQNGATQWKTFGIPHSSGAIYATAYDSNADPKFRCRPCVITENHEWVEIQTPPADIILLSDVNEAGTVVGYRHVGGRYPGFEWTKGAGYQLLGNPRSTYVPRAINQQGMIVGYTSTGDGRVKVPHVWMPPEKQDGDRKSLTLKIPAGFFDATCPDVNNKGVVLMTCRKEHTNDADTFYLETPYIWSRDKGYTALPHSRYANNRPVAISTDGSVLINSWDNPEQNYVNPNRVQTSYLYRDGKTTRLPDYPGADQTTYLFMSDDGLLVGLAAFKDRDNPHAKGHLNLTFLISVDQ